ncbi:MAG TPA: sialidase family protein [Chitinophagaceae bacterium]|nr:sialidase family protein [Chitinophagaceae bacterium]
MKKLSAFILSLSFFICLNAAAQSGSVQWGQEVIINDAPGHYGSQYGRMLHLANGHWLAAFTIADNKGYRVDPSGGLRLEVAESRDHGQHWERIAVLADKGRDLDNAALIQLPDSSILLGGRSVRWQESYRLPVYRSTDQGKTWKRISMIDANEGAPGALGHPDKGVYEPHFCFLKDGRLAVMYANEKHVTDSVSYSQIISERISADFGHTWGKEIRVAYTPGDHASRPGMPVWTRMKNGRYIVVYEVCGPKDCNIYNKISDDGITWPVGLGQPIAGQTGAPYILSLSDGRLLVTSNRENISISDDNGVSWELTKTEHPWPQKKSYAKDWTQTIWSALYQMGPDEIGMITSVKRDSGGHGVRLRFGKVKGD